MAILASLVRWTARGILMIIAAYFSLLILITATYWIVLVFGTMTNPPRGESYLWRINGSPPSYLYGTVHIPWDLIWPSAPQNTKEAFEKANIIYTESQPPANKTMQQFSDECCRLPVNGDTTIKNLLPRTLWHKYLRLVEMLPPKFHELHPDLAKMNPYCVAQIIHIYRNIKFKEDEDEYVPRLPTEILDSAIDLTAQSRGKIQRYIEQRPCLPWERMPLRQALGVMESTFINDKTCLFAYHTNATDQEIAAMYLHNSPQSLDDWIAKIWKRCENGSAQEQDLLRYIEEYSEDQLLRVRNSQWAPEIIRLLRGEPNSYFFAFGAGHFQGEHRVQKHLEAAGFKVDYVGADDPLNHDPKTDIGFWDWFRIILGIYLSVIPISVLIRSAKIKSPENNTNGDDLRDFLRFLEILCETRHLHTD